MCLPAQEDEAPGTPDGIPSTQPRNSAFFGARGSVGVPTERASAVEVRAFAPPRRRFLALPDRFKVISPTEPFSPEPVPRRDCTIERLIHGGPSASDGIKLQFIRDQLARTFAFEKEVHMDGSLVDALEWTVKRSPQQVMAERERIVRDIEDRAYSAIDSGQARLWLERADDRIREVAATVNGPICEYLASVSLYDDPGCVAVLRDGAPLIGRIPRVGLGSPIDLPANVASGDLRSGLRQRNSELLRSLKADKHADELLRVTLADARMGRMSGPVPVYLS